MGILLASCGCVLGIAALVMMDRRHAELCARLERVTRGKARATAIPAARGDLTDKLAFIALALLAIPMGLLAVAALETWRAFVRFVERVQAMGA